ncbi:hypothetical protein BN1708_019261, partial [Verticillium longisporum]
RPHGRGGQVARGARRPRRGPRHHPRGPRALRARRHVPVGQRRQHAHPRGGRLRAHDGRQGHAHAQAHDGPGGLCRRARLGLPRPRRRLRHH